MEIQCRKHSTVPKYVRWSSVLLCRTRVSLPLPFCCAHVVDDRLTLKRKMISAGRQHTFLLSITFLHSISRHDLSDFNGKQTYYAEEPADVLLLFRLLADTVLVLSKLVCLPSSHWWVPDSRPWNDNGRINVCSSIELEKDCIHNWSGQSA